MDYWHNDLEPFTSFNDYDVFTPPFSIEIEKSTPNVDFHFSRDSTSQEENKNIDNFEKSKDNIKINNDYNLKTVLKNKTKNNSGKKKHTKYDDDNLRRKCKHILLSSVFNFINEKLIKMYHGNIGKGFLIKQLRTLEQKKKSDCNLQYYKNLLNKTIREIFSDKISSRNTFLPPDHNKTLIQKLLNEEDEIKKKYFNDLFGLTFLQCLEHFIEKKFYNELNGMDVLKDEIKKYSGDGDEDYVQNIIYYFNNYEKIIIEKKTRKSRKNDLKINK
jgi:hypothetical protein